MAKGKRERQEGAIKRLEKTIALHEANATLTKQILEDHLFRTNSPGSPPGSLFVGRVSLFAIWKRL